MSQALTVLTIEDEAPIRRGIAAYLEDSGFHMLEADDGIRGLEVMRTQRPDAVLCDLRLPGMDGLEVLSTITREFPETPVIVVSGVGQLSYAVQALKRGAWDYVTKPIPEMGVLEGALWRALERARLLRENRRYRMHLEALNRELSRTLHQLQTDERAARRIQFQLLPEDGWQFGDYRFTRRLYPARLLSGDFVDYFPIDERHAGFYMADVSGHGAASAFVTVMVKTLVGQYQEGYEQDGDETILHPERTLERLNRDVCRQHLDQYLTMFYGVLDREGGQMTCSNGGQFPYPMLYDGAQARPLTSRSRPVGLFDDSRYTPRRLELPEASALWLISDGALELLPQGSLRAKRDALCACVQRSPQALPAELATSLGIAEPTTTLPDDVAFLAVSRGRHG
jgi:sigma-B regulation protein RsbU (phosphoserine phosphatase)